MKPSKEKLLLGIVVAAVAGVAAMDGKYAPVPVPSTKPPSGIPEPPAGPEEFPRWPPVRGRTMIDPYSDLVSPPLVELEELPSLSMPVAEPPVRPWIHMDAIAGHRHFLFDPAELPVKETESEGSEGDPGNGGAAGGEAGFAGMEGPSDAKPEEETKKEEEKVDLSKFDWVRLRDSQGAQLYGKIDLLPEARAAGKSRFHLLVDAEMEFTFWQVDTKGKFVSAPVPFRSRTETLGFADTFENNYGSMRVRKEAAAGRTNLDVPALRELIAWSMEQAKLPKYPRRACWAAAAKDLREIVVRSPDDKETLKDLGRTLRLLQDLEGEAELYDWWLARQKISKDPEVLALMAEALELLGLRDRARMRYEECLVTGTDPRVRVRLGDLLLSTGNLEDARKAVELFRRAAQDGERAAGTVGEARALLALGDVDGAEAAVGRVSGSERDGGWYNAAGAIHYARGRMEEAGAHFQAALDKSRAGEESFAVARTNLALVKARTAAVMAEADAGRRTLLDEARKLADAALVDDPMNYYWPLVVRAYAERAAGEREKAVETMQEAVAALPTESYGRYLLGEFLLRDGRRAEARTKFLEATRISPRFPDALGGVGRAGGGEAGESKEYLRRAMEMEPKTALWPFLAARMAFQDEGLPLPARLKDAEKDLKTLLEKVDRNHSFAQAALGWVCYMQGNANEALDRWNTALRLIAAYRAPSPREAQVAEDLGTWLKESIRRVDKWMRTKIWREEFNRPDGPTVGNGIHEDEQPGVKLAIKDGAAQFGPGKFGSGPTPCLWVEKEANKVLKGFIEVQVAATEPISLDVRILMAQGKTETTVMGLRKTEPGDVQLLLKKDQRTKPADETIPLAGVRWPDDGRVSFGFVKLNEEKGTVALLLDGKPIAGYEAVEMPSLIKNRGGKLRFEVKCLASNGTEVNARVEAIEIWLDTQ